MAVRRCLGVMAVVAGLAACGGSANPVGSSPAAGSRDAASSPAPVPSATATILPASADGPTTCTVYERGYATQVVFDSESLNVSPECQAWSSQEAGDGYLWGYQPTTAAVGATAVRVCELRDPSGKITANVVDDAAMAPISAVERARSAAACHSMTAAGWRP